MRHAIGIFVVCAAIATVMPRLAHAGAASVYGIIKTSTGGNSGCNRVVKRVKVDAYDEDVGPDDHLGTDYTGLNGLFQVAYVQYENSDVYINVTYKFEATDSRYILVRNAGSGDTIVEEQVGGVSTDLPDGDHNLGTLNLASNKANIGSEAGDCLAWVGSHCADWTMPNDLIAYALAGSTGSFCSGDSISIELQDYDNPTQNGGAFSDIHHETGHFVQYNAYGDQWPTHSWNGNHWFDTESDEGFAILEGWAEYVAYCTAPQDWKNDLPNPGSLTWWRGTDGTGTDNAGDIVEGALWRIWATLADFGGTLKVLIDDEPDHIQAWLGGYGADQSWNNMEDTWNAFEENGIVYTRACITGFSEGAPPNDAPASTGNKKAISLLSKIIAGSFPCCKNPS